MIHGRKILDGRIYDVPLVRAAALSLFVSCAIVSAQSFSQERPIAAQRFNDPIRLVIPEYAVAANNDGGYAAWTEERYDDPVHYSFGIAFDARGVPRLETRTPLGSGEVMDVVEAAGAFYTLVRTSDAAIIRRTDGRLETRIAVAGALKLRWDGSHFLLSQLPPSMRFRVNSHSSSPIYAEQAQAKGTLLSSRGAIGSDDLVEMVQPDNVDELKAKAKKRDESKAELQKEMLKIQAEKARAKPAARR